MSWKWKKNNFLKVGGCTWIENKLGQKRFARADREKQEKKRENKEEKIPLTFSISCLSEKIEWSISRF